MTTQAVASSDERGQPKLVNGQRSNINKDNWLGFVGDVVNFTGEVCFKSMLRIDGHFSGNVTSADGTLIVSTGAQVTKAVIKVAVAKINGTVEGDILASKQPDRLPGRAAGSTTVAITRLLLAPSANAASRM